MLKIGIVGAGTIGRMHAEAIQNRADCVLAAVADVLPGRAEALADGAPCYTDYTQMCAQMCGQSMLDAVIINLPHGLHCEAGVYFLSHGVSVLMEKPMANTAAECDEMIRAARKSGAKLAVGHVQRYFPAYEIIKQYCESGELGPLTMVTEIRNTDYFTNRPAWFLRKKSAGGGIVMNYGAHTLDKLFYTTGLCISDVSAAMSNRLTKDDVEAAAQVLLRLENGVSVSASYCGCHVPGFYETVFYFTHGAVKTDGGERVWLGKDGSYKELALPAQNGTFIARQLSEFVKLLRAEPCNIASAEYGRAVVAALERIYRAAN